MGRSRHEHYMALALEQARFADQAGEVPVGAIVEYKGEVIGAGYNQTLRKTDPSAHAEIVALRQAARNLGNHRLVGANLYVTLEPCVMCAGAILHARIDCLIYATGDERWGAAGSVANVLQSPLLNHQCRVVSGVSSEPASLLLKAFFAARRE